MVTLPYRSKAPKRASTWRRPWENVELGMFTQHGGEQAVATVRANGNKETSQFAQRSLVHRPSSSRGHHHTSSVPGLAKSSFHITPACSNGMRVAVLTATPDPGSGDDRRPASYAAHLVVDAST